MIAYKFDHRNESVKWKVSFCSKTNRLLIVLQASCSFWTLKFEVLSVRILSADPLRWAIRAISLISLNSPLFKSFWNGPRVIGEHLERNLASACHRSPSFIKSVVLYPSFVRYSESITLISISDECNSVRLFPLIIWFYRIRSSVEQFELGTLKHKRSFTERTI